VFAYGAYRSRSRKKKERSPLAVHRRQLRVAIISLSKVRCNFYISLSVLSRGPRHLTQRLPVLIRKPSQRLGHSLENVFRLFVSPRSTIDRAVPRAVLEYYLNFLISTCDVHKEAENGAAKNAEEKWKTVTSVYGHRVS